jgi:hypothetical protein
MCMSVTTDVFWTDNQIYWTLWHRAWLHFHITIIHTHTTAHSHVFTSHCLVAASKGGRPPSSGFPNCPRPQLPNSHSNNSRLRLSSPLTHCTPLANFTPLTVLLITSRHGPRRKRRSSVAIASVGMPTWSLLSHFLVTAVVHRAII